MARPEAGTARGPADDLLGLIDRLEALLEGSGLSELEIAVGQTSIVLRTPEAVGIDTTLVASLQRALSQGGAAAAESAEALPRESPPADETNEAPSSLHAVVAPLTGIFYISPSPESAPYVREGGEVNVGQVIGLIEAMKLFNEIKSDVSGRVVRIAAETGTLVKAKQALIEVEPS